MATQRFVATMSFYYEVKTSGRVSLVFSHSCRQMLDPRLPLKALIGRRSPAGVTAGGTRQRLKLLLCLVLVLGPACRHIAG